MATDGKGTVLQPGERETISMPGNKVPFVHRQPDSAYSLVEWTSEPGAPGLSVHVHRMTDEEAREVVEQLNRDAGYEPLYAGPIENAAAQENFLILKLLGAISQGGMGPFMYRIAPPDQL